MVQYFKGDLTELKFDESGKGAMDQVGQALDAFYEQAYETQPFLLMLYDEGRVPFSRRIAREQFIPFIRQTLANFPFTGTFEAYLDVLQAVFGVGSTILFNVPSPGTLEIDVAASNTVEHEWVVVDFEGGVYVESQLQDSTGDDLVFTSIQGVENEYDLNLMISEIIPAGIYHEVNLSFFTLFSLVVEDADGDEFSLIDSLGNQIVAVE